MPGVTGINVESVGNDVGVGSETEGIVEVEIHRKSLSVIVARDGKPATHCRL